MNIEVDTVKGFRDILPEEARKRKAVRQVIEQTFELFGFLPIETPVIEYDELMRPSILPGEQEDEAVSDRFRLKDRGGRNLGLRYEFTFQLARLLKLNPTLKLPFKRYQIGEVFRDEPIGEGRYRQFTQCDIDILGDSSVNADVECLAVAQTIIKKLGISAVITINNRKLIQAIIESCELNNEKQVMRELDKLTKVGEDSVKASLRKYGDANQIVTLFKLLSKDLAFFVQQKFQGAEELQQVIDRAKMCGVKVLFNPLMIRGLGYYTGSIFEITVPGKNTLIAGGRYDKTVGKYLQRDIPAVGISFGLDRLTSEAQLSLQANTIVQLISIQQDKATSKLASTLREAGIACNISFDKPGKAMEYANAYHIPFAIFIGENEIQKKKFTLRDLATGVEKELSESRLVSYLQKKVLTK